MITGLHPSDSNPYSAIKESSVNINPLMTATPWRHPHSHGSAHSHPHPVYSNPYVYDAAAAVALVGYSPYASSYSPHMDLAGRRKNATRETTATLKAWLYEHRKNPYPTKSEKVYLAIMTKMTLTQVSTWFANARRRLKKENKMTWSPRNRTNEDDDEDDDNDNDHHHHHHSDRHGLESTSDVQSDEDDHSQATVQLHQQTNSLSSSLTSMQEHKSTSFVSNLPYLSNVLHQAQSNISSKEEASRKRKFDQVESQSLPTIIEKKRSSAIWSLAEMAEKNETKQCQSSSEQIPVNKTRLSSSSSSSSTTSVSVQDSPSNRIKSNKKILSPSLTISPNSIPISSTSTSSFTSSGASTTTTISSSSSMTVSGAFKPLIK